MPLTDDQRAMLRLLAQREQGYEDIAALMGLSVDEVRDKVKGALAQLEDEGIEPPSVPEPPPAPEPPKVVEPEPPVPPLPDPPAAPEAPPEPKPVPPPEPQPAADQPSSIPAPATKSTSRRRPTIALLSNPGARGALVAGLAAIAIVVVLLVIGIGGDDSDSGTTTASGESATAAEEAGAGQSETTAGGKEPTGAILEAVDGSDASGSATFGRVKNALALAVKAEGLEPSPKGGSYTIWLAQTTQKMLPLASTQVPDSGEIAASYEVPTEVLAYLANETFGRIVVTRTVNNLLEASLARATKEKQSPKYTGSPVLAGTVTGPIVGAANRENE